MTISGSSSSYYYTDAHTHIQQITIINSNRIKFDSKWNAFLLLLLLRDVAEDSRSRLRYNRNGKLYMLAIEVAHLAQSQTYDIV